MLTYTFVEGASLYELGLFIESNGALVNLSSGFTFELEVLPGWKTAAAGFTKTTDITGAVGAGSEPNGTPNLVIVWDAATDLPTLSADTYTAVLRMTRTADSKVDTRKFHLQIVDADT